MDMEEIGLLRTAVTLARQVNSLRVEHQYVCTVAHGKTYIQSTCLEVSGIHTIESHVLCNGYHNIPVHSTTSPDTSSIAVAHGKTYIQNRCLV